MKLLFSSDWHLGKFVYGQSMLDEQSWFIDNVFFTAVSDHAPDAIVIAGDIFDRAIAPTAALALFDDVMTRIAQLGIPLIVITGNHDGAERMSLGRHIMRAGGIHLFTEISDCTQTVALTDADGLKVVFHPLPYFDPAQARAFTGNDEATGYAQLYADVISGIPIDDTDARHILISHCTVLGSHFSDSESGAMVGGSNEISVDCFAPFDAVLLGHLHSPQKPADNIMYSGSPLRYSFSSTERNKALELVTITDRDITFEPLPITPRREMRTICGAFDDLLGDGTSGSDDFICAELTEGQYIFEPMARLREKFPNILGITYSENVSVDGDQSDRALLRHRLRARSIGDREVFSAFLSQMCAVSPTDDDLDRFDEICSAAFTEEVNDDAP